jgi:hypothetical protein
MKSNLKNRLLSLLLIILTINSLAFWYKLAYSMELAENRGINNTELSTKLLIATQGSDFKNAVVTNVINFYSKDTVHIKTIDVSQLQQIKPDVYSVIVIFHTWEYGKPPQEVRQFISENVNYKDRIIVFATSGAGNNKMDGIDALAGESILENTSDVSEKIIEKIDKIIK